MAKYLVVSTICFERANDPVKKLRTEPAPFACKTIIIVTYHFVPKGNTVFTN